jgi:inosose dehydratase
MDSSRHPRREFLKRASVAGLASLLGADLLCGAPALLPNPVGYATIAWPERKFNHALETISALGFKGVQLLGWVCDAYRGARVLELRERLQALRLQPVTLSCSRVRLDPDRPKDELGEVRAYASFFQRLGGLYLQVTDGGDPHKHYPVDTLKALGARIGAMGKLAQDFGLTLGYHPHFGTIGETREGLARILEVTDPRNVWLIADVGHLTLGGADPAEAVRAYPERLMLTHFKDVRPEVAERARQSRDLVRREKHLFCEIGAGAVDFPSIVKAFRETRFEGWVIVELDAYKSQPGGADKSAQVNRDAVQKLGLTV